KCGPALRHSLWLLVLLRLLLPPGVMYWPWAVPISLGREAPKTETVAACTAPVTWVAVQDATPVETVVSTTEKTAPIEPAKQEAAVSTPTDWSAWAWRLGLGVWAVGAALVALLHLHGLVRIVRLVRAGEEAPPWLHRRVADMSRKLGI